MIISFNSYHFGRQLRWLETPVWQYWFPFILFFIINLIHLLFFSVWDFFYYFWAFFRNGLQVVLRINNFFLIGWVILFQFFLLCLILNSGIIFTLFWTFLRFTTSWLSLNLNFSISVRNRFSPKQNVEEVSNTNSNFGPKILTLSLQLTTNLKLYICSLNRK